MSIKATNQEYFENQSQTRVLYIPNLSSFLFELAKQSLRLPHEVQELGQNAPMGSTEEDIVASIDRGSKMAYAMASPLRALLSVKKGEKWDYKPAPEVLKLSLYDQAMARIEWLYLMLEEADTLNERTIDMDLQDEEEYIFGGEVDEGNTSNDMPANLTPPNDKALGSVEGKDAPSVAAPGLA